jgi:hypothetical protein
MHFAKRLFPALANLAPLAEPARTIYLQLAKSMPKPLTRLAPAEAGQQKARPGPSPGGLEVRIAQPYVRAAGLSFARSMMPATMLAGTGSKRKGSMEYAARPLDRERIAVA